MSQVSPEDRALRRALQFSMRSLLVGMALCALLALAFVHLGAVWGTAILWFLILATAHVAANALGTRHAPHAARESHDRPPSSETSALKAAACCAPATQLRASRGFGYTLLLVTSLCALAGLLVGSVALVLIVPVNLAGAILGSFSAAILGGFLGFVIGSFVMVATRSFREAVDQELAAAGPTNDKARMTKSPSP